MSVVRRIADLFTRSRVDFDYAVPHRCDRGVAPCNQGDEARARGRTQAGVAVSLGTE